MVYIINYFPFGGRGELLRLIAEEGGIAYKNNYLSFAELAQNRAAFPYGQLPVLSEEGSDFQLAQTGAIVRFLAKEAGLIPADARQAALADSITEGVAEFRAKAYSAFFKQGDQEKQEALTKYRDSELKTVLTKFEAWLKKNGGQYFAGDKLSFADLAVYDFLNENQTLINFADEIPTLIAFQKSVAARPNISAYSTSDRVKPNLGDNQKIHQN